jgi:hypothetical protein
MSPSRLCLGGDFLFLMVAEGRRCSRSDLFKDALGLQPSGVPPRIPGLLESGL